jgi:tetratricopeptide (TPR) repeat protein
MKASALLQKATELERRGQLAAAISGYQQAVACEPSNIDALLLLGQAQLRQGNLDASGKALRRVVTLRPQHGGAQTLLGMVLGRTGHVEDAIACFERALESDPASELALIWKADLLAGCGRNDEAIIAFDKVLALNPANVVAWNNRGLALESVGRDAEAIESFRRALALQPGSAEVRFSLANALHRSQRHEEAVKHYRQAIAQWPDFARAHAGLGTALFALRRWEGALQSLRQAIRLEPGDAKLHDAIGLTLRHLQRDEESLESFDKALSLSPGDSQIIGNKAGALYVLGRIDEARGLIERAIALNPGDAGLYRDLAEMKRFAPGDPMIGTMEGLLPRIDAQGQLKLHFALAKVYADVAQPKLAFPHLAQGNALRRRQIDYDETAELASLDSIAAAFTPPLMRVKAGQGDSSDRPIFIIGMPRSGTTLVERILASHPRVFGAGEQKKFEEAITSVIQPGQPGYPTVVSTLTPQQLKAAGAAYLSKMAALVPDDRRFTDKLPANYNYVGLIHLALPNARIINVRRNPLDTCLSIFSIDFADPPGFAYDLGELGRFYLAYERLMDHWRQVLPEGVMLDVQYEDVVEDIEQQARQMLARCGLEWDDACLAFHDQHGTVRTASAYQVRQPLYRSSLGRWKVYADELRPLLEALNMKPECLSG